MTAALEKSIKTEIMRWSKEVLGVPSPHFNGLPPCPYARQAWADEKVAIVFKHEENYQSLYSCVSRYDDKYDLAILVDLANDKPPEAFHEYLDDLNDFIATGAFIDKDIWLMGFHPDDDQNDFVDDVEFEAETETPYAIIFVQRLSALQKAADKLNKKGYYTNYRGLYNADDIYSRRAEFLRRLENGETTT